MTTNTVTNQQLRQFLSGLGFLSQASVEPKCQVFEHPDSGARTLLPANKDDEQARLADVLSIRTHLSFRGHVDEREFDEFVARVGQTA